MICYRAQTNAPVFDFLGKSTFDEQTLIMLPLILIVIESNPLVNGRAVEALRVGAGLCVWKKLHIILYLSGKGLLLMDWEALQFEGSEHCSEYLSILRGNSVVIYATEEEIKNGSQLLKTAVKTISLAEWSRLAEQARCMIRF